jgi:multidrug efflux system outer membrane protein
MTKIWRTSLCGALAATTALSMTAGCTQGTDYVRPQLQVPTQFRAQLTPAEATSYADLPWWDAFRDPALQSLLSEAVNNNLDVQIAAARIEQARAELGVVRSQAMPQVDYRVGVGGERTAVQGLRGVEDVDVGTASAIVSAAWELDLWGRIRRATEAANANLYREEEVQRGVMLSLVSDVAIGYFRLLELDRQLQVAQESSRTYKSTHELFNLRYEAGRDSNLPVQRAQAIYNSSLARTAELRRLIAAQENALCILLGSYPRTINRGQLADQVIPATPLGSTSDILQRRPDIRAAEQGMIAANAEIGVALANFFPRIGLSAFLGGEGFRIGGENDSFGLWGAALSAAGPIFNGGRLQSIYEGRKAYWDETIAQYRKIVLVAFQETSDALVAQQTLVDQRKALEAQIASLRESNSLALIRYDGGRANYFEVLEAQQQLYPAEYELARTRGDQLIATVNLYKALGGGWRQTAAEWKHQSK